MAKQARWYQEQCEASFWEYLNKGKGEAPVGVIPTGGGKSLVSARTAQRIDSWGASLLYVTYRKELVEQTEADFVEAGLKPSVYSAGLKRRELGGQLVMGNIHSIYNKACDFEAGFDVVLVDEAQYIPEDGEGMFQELLQATKAINPKRKLLGLTATPYRLNGGLIYGPGKMFDGVSFEVGVKELIAQGYLSKLTSKGTKASISTDGVDKRGGEFVASQLNKAVSEDEATIISACAEIVERTADRSSVLVFATGVDHGKAVTDQLEEQCNGSAAIGYIDGNTPSKQRAKVIADFRSRKLKYLVNIDVLTVGFDAPNVDAIALLRPTLSPGLYYQMVGRGLRKADGKADCLVLDFAGNVRRHGPVDAIKVEDKQQGGKGDGEPPSKVCPSCSSILAASARYCEDCGYAWPEAEVLHDAHADDEAEVLSVDSKRTVLDVTDVTYQAWKKRGWQEGDKRTLRVMYHTGFASQQSEWVCIEHDGWVRAKAVKWWQARCDFECPIDVDRAELYSRHLRKPCQIVIEEKPDSDFPEIVDCIFDTDEALPVANEPDLEEFDDDDIPF